MTEPRSPVAQLRWVKSSYSGAQGLECVEVAAGLGGAMVRDSKDPEGPTLEFSGRAWAAFIAEVRGGALPYEG
jgi:hypothetical protein